MSNINRHRKLHFHLIRVTVDYDPRDLHTKTIKIGYANEKESLKKHFHLSATF